MAFKRKAAAFFAAVTLLVNFAASALAGADSHVVRIGFYTMPGFQTVEQDGTLSGYMYDYLQEIAKYTHWTYEYVNCSFSECLQKSNRVKLIS